MLHIQLLTRFSRRTTFWIGLLLLIMILFAAAQAMSPPHSTYRWAKVQEIGSTSALSSVAFVRSGFVWHTPQFEVPLVYSPLAKTDSVQPLLDYPGIMPRLWQAVPAQTNTYHVIWLDRNQRLYSALIDGEGQTQRGPIELAPAASSFIALPYDENRVFTAWINDNNLFVANIDQVGRPRPRLAPLLGDVSSIAGAAGSGLHLAWLESSSPGYWKVNFQTIMPDDIILESFETLHTFQLGPDEVISSFTLGLDQSHAYIFWGLTGASQADIEHVYTLSFPIDQPANVQPDELTLPVQFEPDDQLPPSNLKLGQVAALPAESGTNAALRWPRAASGQHTLFPLAITVRTGTMWSPAVVYFQSGKALGYQIVAPLPANAGPPTLAIDPMGNLHLAWSGLDGAIPTLFIGSTQGRGLIREQVTD